MNLELRPLTQADALRIAEYCNNYNLYKTTLSLPYPYTLEDAKSWIEMAEANAKEQKSFEFAIVEQASGLLVGVVGLSQNKANRKGELAYWIAEEHWGKGYGSWAANAILDFAFREMNFHKVFARFFANNPASGRIMQKIGMKEVGVFVDDVYKEDKFVTAHYYEILQSEWQLRRGEAALGAGAGLH